MPEVGKPTSTKSAIALFIFLGVILLFLPCVSIIIVKLRRSRNHRAQRKAEQGNSDYWTNLAAAEALTKPKPVAQSAAIQRDARGNKVLPKVYRNKEGIFERASVEDEGTYGAPESLMEEPRKEPTFKDLRMSSEEVSQRPTQFEGVWPVRPHHPAEHNAYANTEGRLLTPEQSHVPSGDFALQPAPKKNLKKKLDEEGTQVQTVNIGRADVGIPDRVRSKIAHVDHASLDVVNIHGHPQAPPSWI